MKLFHFRKNESNSKFNLDEIKHDISLGAALVDVRTPEEYSQEHARGAINIPLQEMYKGNFGSLSQEQKLYLYCRSGSRATQAMKLLHDNGYVDVINLKTLFAWKELGGESD